MSTVPLGAKLLFDGAGGLIFSHVSYMEINGFEIEGPGASIDITDAQAHRLDKPFLSYYGGRGIAIWGSEGNHHITVKNNLVHHCPNSGIRANYIDYLIIENNDVHTNCWWSPNAESGVVIAQATNIDTKDTVKLIFRNNRVWNNGNKVVYYNPTWGEGSDYGQPGYTKIVDGQGLYLTRSKDTYLAGRVLIENNLSVNNGVNGICFHHTNRGVIRNNTVYKNGQYPDRPVSGITINGADDVQVYNNIIVGRDDAVLQNFENSTNVSLSNNMIWEGTNSFGSGAVLADPLFVNPGLEPLTADFSLKSSSSAIDAGVTPVSEFDIIGKPRLSGTKVDMGAWEYQPATALISSDGSLKSRLFTIVETSKGILLEVTSPVTVQLFSMNGKSLVSRKVEHSSLLGEGLAQGIYLMQIRGENGVETVHFRVK